ncbi:DUF6350 family protein [Demetria terragena]|uniref:cell division protein PerM n=1 Tax=Demetria terragena TaxID=63959 RepID=UPI00035F516D|nr:DUF6350 family protein [Demetria terragena]
MSLLERTRQIVPTRALDPAGPWRRLSVAFGFGAVGALALALMLVLPAMAAWVTDPQSPDSWFEALTLAPVVWVMAHRGSTGVPGEEVAVTFPLLGLTIAAVLCARSAARAALVQTEGQSHDHDEAAWWHLPAVYVGGYTLTGVALALVAWLGPARPNPIYVIPGALLVASVGLVLGVLKARKDGIDPSLDTMVERVIEPIPVVIRRAWQPALRGAGILLGLGALLVLAAVVLSWSRISEISQELGTGLTGGIVLALGQLFALPNAAAWGGAWLSGAAFQIGPVSVGHAAMSPGILPMVPALGALPEAGAGPAWAPFTPLIPVAVGLAVGWWASGALTALASFTMKIQTAATAGGIAALLVLLVAFLGSMGVSGGSMSYVGPSWVTILLLPIEVALGAVASASALHYWRTLR